MSRKAKVKLKRGKIKFKLKSDDRLLLAGGDDVRTLLEAALASGLGAGVPVLEQRTLTPRPVRGELRAADTEPSDTR